MASDLVSWQLDGNSRSAWDIMWACFSTVFACTWTVIHSDVPSRTVSENRRQMMYLRTWFVAILIPEFLFAASFRQLLVVIASRKVYNLAQIKKGPGELPSDPTKWSFPQTFCAKMGGLVLQSKDEWIYRITSDEEMTTLIQNNLIAPSDIHTRDIEDRAKADWLAKLFTILQATWFLCNVIARWAYHLPVTPIELAAVAYVFLAMFIYGFWWFKPKDIGTPIPVLLQCGHDDLPRHVSSIVKPNRWVPLREPIEEEGTFSAIWYAIKSPIISDKPIEGDALPEAGRLSNRDMFLNAITMGFAALIYTGIHLAAWDFAFPTHAEWLAWIIFSFIALGTLCIFNAANLGNTILIWLKREKKFPSPMRFLYKESAWKWEVDIQLWIKNVALALYMLARLGIIALIFSSFRKLPKEAYTSIEWVTSVPHF